MEFRRLPLGIYQANCYIAWEKESKKAVIIDPGAEFKTIEEFVDKNDLSIEGIIITHAHGDHIGALSEAKNHYRADVLIHQDDHSMLLDKNRNHSQRMGLNPIEVQADRKLKDGDKLELGSIILEIIHTPGHSKGSICIKCGDVIFSGDTLFAGSIGRTDLEGGSFEEIIKSIKEKIMVFEDETQVYPGHGPSTTVGAERYNNPFL